MHDEQRRKKERRKKRKWTKTLFSHLVIPTLRIISGTYTEDIHVAINYQRDLHSKHFAFISLVFHGAAPTPYGNPI